MRKQRAGIGTAVVHCDPPHPTHTLPNLIEAQNLLFGGRKVTWLRCWWCWWRCVQERGRDSRYRSTTMQGDTQGEQAAAVVIGVRRCKTICTASRQRDVWRDHRTNTSSMFHEHNWPSECAAKSITLPPLAHKARRKRTPLSSPFPPIPRPFPSSSLSDLNPHLVTRGALND